MNKPAFTRNIRGMTQVYLVYWNEQPSYIIFAEINVLYSYTHQNLPDAYIEVKQNSYANLAYLVCIAKN